MDSAPTQSFAPSAMVAMVTKITWQQWSCIAALAFVWIRLFAALVPEWELDPQYAHGWSIPLLSAILFIRRWHQRPSPDPPKTPLVGWALCSLPLLLLLPVRFIGVVHPEARPLLWIHGAIALVFTFGILWNLGGFRWVRHFAFPILFVLVAMPWGRGFQTGLTNALMNWVASVSVQVVLNLGIPAQQSGNTITLENTVVGVDEACSGVYSLQGSIMVGLFLGEHYRLWSGARFLLVAFAISFSLFLNIVRATLLTWVASSSGEAGLERIHDPAGLIILVIVFFGTVGFASFLAHWFVPPTIAAETAPRPLLISRKSSTVFFICIGWLLLTDMAAALYFHTPTTKDHSQFWTLNLQNIKAVSIKREPLATSARQYLRFSEGEGTALELPDGTLIRIVELRWNGGEISAAGPRIHNPMICLRGLGYELQETLPPVRFDAGGVPCLLSQSIFEFHGKTAFVFHGLWDAGHAASLDRTHDQSLASALKAVVEKRRLPHAQVLLALMVGPETPKEALLQMQSFLSSSISFSESP